MLNINEVCKRVGEDRRENEEFMEELVVRLTNDILPGKD